MPRNKHSNKAQSRITSGETIFQVSCHLRKTFWLLITPNGFCITCAISLVAATLVHNYPWKVSLALCVFVISVGMIMELFKCKMIISILVFPHFSYAWRTVSTSSTRLQNLETAVKIYLKSSRASKKISESFPRGIFQIEMLSIEIFHGEEIHFREIRFHSQPWLSRVELFLKHGRKVWLQVARWIAFRGISMILKNSWNIWMWEEFTQLISELALSFIPRRISLDFINIAKRKF